MGSLKAVCAFVSLVIFCIPLALVLAVNYSCPNVNGAQMMLIKLSRFDEERRREKSEDDEEDEAAAAAAAMRWGLPPLPSVSLLGFVSYQL